MGTIIVGLILVLIVALIIRSMVKDKKSGKSSCGGNCGACGACPHGSLCDNSKLLLVKDSKKEQHK